MNCKGGKPHNTDIWAIPTVKFDTVYRVLNYLPNTLISCLLFSSVHEVPFTPVKCIYFPTVSFWVVNPIQPGNSKEMQHHLKQKENKNPESLLDVMFSLNLAFSYNKLFHSLHVFFAWCDHLVVFIYTSLKDAISERKGDGRLNVWQ